MERKRDWKKRNITVFNFVTFNFQIIFSRAKMLKTNKQKLTVVIFKSNFGYKRFCNLALLKDVIPLFFKWTTN